MVFFSRHFLSVATETSSIAATFDKERRGVTASFSGGLVGMGETEFDVITIRGAHIFLSFFIELGFVFLGSSPGTLQSPPLCVAPFDTEV